MPETIDRALYECIHREIEYTGQQSQETPGSKPWDCDGWRVHIGGIHGPGRKVRRHTFDYFTGLGHRKDRSPVAPSIANVMQCLLLESDAALQSFDSWCEDFGYDNDSIRAFNTYQSCCGTARKLRDLFTHEQLAALRAEVIDL